MDSLQQVVCLPWGVLPLGLAWYTSTGRRRGSIPIKSPNHLNWPLLTQRSSSPTPGSPRMSELLTLSFSLHWANLGRKIISGLLYPRFQSFCLYPELMTEGEGQDAERLVNQHIGLCGSLPLHHNRPIQHPHTFLNWILFSARWNPCTTWSNYANWYSLAPDLGKT